MDPRTLTYQLIPYRLDTYFVELDRGFANVLRQKHLLIDLVSHEHSPFEQKKEPIYSLSLSSKRTNDIEPNNLDHQQ